MLKQLNCNSYDILGKMWVTGEVYVDSQISYLRARCPKNTILGYFSPHGSRHSSIQAGKKKMLRERKNNSSHICLVHKFTKRCIYTSINNELHFSLFMKFSTKIEDCNVTLLDNGSISSMKYIHGSFTNPIILVCYYGNFAILNKDFIKSETMLPRKCKPVKSSPSLDDSKIGEVENQILEDPFLLNIDCEISDSNHYNDDYEGELTFDYHLSESLNYHSQCDSNDHYDDVSFELQHSPPHQEGLTFLGMTEREGFVFDVH